MDCNNCINRLLPICARCFERASKYEPKPIPEKKPEPRVYSIIPSTEKENIKRMYWDEKLSFRTIGKKYGVSQGVVQRYIKFYFTTKGRVKDNSRTNINGEQAKSLYESGLSVLKVSLAMNQTPGNVYNVLKDLGVTMRTTRSKRKSGYEQQGI